MNPFNFDEADTDKGIDTVMLIHRDCWALAEVSVLP